MKTFETLDVKRDERGAVEVCLDTPSSKVNILTGEVVTEIYEVLSELDQSSVSALVFTSAKERSFINGAQLMLASAVQSPESIFGLTRLLRRTYRAVADFDAPTIAAVRGACYGCGAEFSLCCDYRIARDGADTTFYMTEIADYLNGPAFGSTQRLPRIIGIENAVGFLVWGHRLWGARAAEAGLVDRVLDTDRFDDEVDAFIGEVLAGSVAPGERVREDADEIDRVRRATLAEIERLPASYRPLFEECLELLVHSARKPGALDDADFERELHLAGRSLVEPQAEAARSFLYLRQLAERVWVRQLPEHRQLGIRASAEDAQARRLADELAARRVAGVRTLAADETPPADHISLEFVSDRCTSGEDAPTGLFPVGVCTEPVGTRPSWATPVMVRWPFATFGLERSEQRIPSTGTRPLVEIAVDERNADEDARRLIAPLFEYLDAAGFSVVVSTPEDGFACDAFYSACLAPLVGYVAAGGEPDDVHMTLSRFGFVPSPLAWLDSDVDLSDLVGRLQQRLPEPLRPQAATALAALLEAGPAQPTEASEDSALGDAVTLSLLHAVRSSLDSGLLRHSALADFICRELLAFPVGRASLCEYATVARVEEMLAAREALSRWLPASVFDSARAYADQGRDFYL